MARPQEEYDTLVRGSLLRGTDGHGPYAAAAFEQEDLFVDVIRRPEGYGLEFASDEGLKSVYQGIRDHYHPEGLIQVIDADENTFHMDPDAWRGGNYEDFVEAYIEFEGFGVEWAPLEEDAEKESLLNIFSNTSHFEVGEPVFDPAWRINESVTQGGSEARKAVFNDIKFFLDER